MLVLNWNPYHNKVAELSDELSFTKKQSNFLSIMETACGFRNSIVSYLTYDAIEGPNAALYRPIVTQRNRKSIKGMYSTCASFVTDAKCFITQQNQKEIEHDRENDRIKASIIRVFGDDRNEWNEIVNESCPFNPFPLVAILSQQNLSSVLAIFKEEGEWKAVVKAHGNQKRVPVPAMVYTILEELNISQFNFITEKENDAFMASYTTCAKFFDGNKDAWKWILKPENIVKLASTSGVNTRKRKLE